MIKKKHIFVCFLSLIGTIFFVLLAIFIYAFGKANIEKFRIQKTFKEYNNFLKIENMTSQKDFEAVYHVYCTTKTDKHFIFRWVRVQNEKVIFFDLLNSDADFNFLDEFFVETNIVTEAIKMILQKEGIIASGTTATGQIRNVLTGSMKKFNMNKPQWAGSVGNFGENILPTSIDLGKEFFAIKKIQEEN